MSDDKNEPAFPVDSAADHQYCGMSLRDYFAAKALQGMITTSGHPALIGLGGCEIDTAQAAYKIADAMILARNA